MIQFLLSQRCSCVFTSPALQENIERSPHVKLKTTNHKLNRTIQNVVYRLQLLELIEPAQRLLAAERLPLRHAVEIARLQPDRQEEALSICFRGTPVEAVLANSYQTAGISLADLRGWITRNCLLDLSQAPFDIRAENLIEGVGACTGCPKRSTAAGCVCATLSAPW